MLLKIQIRKTEKLPLDFAILTLEVVGNIDKISFS